MSDALTIKTELQGIRAALEGAQNLKKGLVEAREAAQQFGETAEQAMQKVREKSSDTLEVLDRLGTAAFLDDFSDRIKYAGEAFMVAEDQSRSFAVRASAAISGLSGITGMWVQSMLAGAQALAAGAASAEQQERAVRTLGGAWDEVRRQTQDTVTAQQALAMQQAFVRNGMSTTAEEMGLLTRAAREYAIATGTDTPAAMQALTQALQQGDREGLRPFKISVQEGTTRSEAYRQAVNQLRTGFGDTASTARTFAEENERLSRSWTEMTNSLFGDLARWTDLRSNIVGVAQALTALREEGGIHGHAERHRASDQERMRGLERRERIGRVMIAAAERLGFQQRLINPNQLRDDQLEFLERSLGNPLGSEDEMRAGLEFAAAARANLQASRAAAAREQGAAAARERAARDRELRAQDRRDRREAMSPEERRRLALERAQAAMAADVRRKRGALQAQLTAEYSAHTGSYYTDWYLDIDSSLEARNAMRAEEEDKARSQVVYEEEQRIAAQQAERERRNAISRAGAERERGFDAYTRQRDLGAQIGDRFGGGRTLQEQMAAPIQGAADTVKSAFDTMSSGLGSFMDTLIESPEKAGEASVQLAKNVLKGIAMMALQKSLFSTAEGIVALTNPATAAAAPGFFAAAGIYAGVAAASGAAAAGIASAQRGAQASPPASAGAGSAGPASISSGRSGGGGERPMIVLNVNGSVLDEGGLEDAIVRGMRGARARGMA